MDSMETPKKPGIMAKLRSSKGFSLVEMAIVLVIIGIIIGAIIKGQDLILNSRAKQVAAAASTWRNLAMAHLDRNGKLPGDGGKTGIISKQVGYSSATVEITSKMPTAPPQPLTVGGMTFYFYFGNSTGAAGGRNVIVICKDSACAKAFSADELEIIKAVDTSIDGASDAQAGQLRQGPVSLGSADTANFILTAAPANVSTAGAATPTLWTGKDGDAAIWAFDRPW